MALDELIARVIDLWDPVFNECPDIAPLARRVLLQRFGVEPTLDEVAELALAVERAIEQVATETERKKAAHAEFMADDETEAPDYSWERQHARGRQVIRKSEHRAG